MGAEAGVSHNNTCILGGPPHPVIMTIRDTRDYFRVLLYSYGSHDYRVGGPPNLYHS